MTTRFAQASVVPFSLLCHFIMCSLNSSSFFILVVAFKKRGYSSLLVLKYVMVETTIH
jgi:hypothetical protein